MTGPRDPDRLVSAFLGEGPTELPARTYDAVRQRIDQTRQRVVFDPWRESHMSSLTRFAIAAAAVVILAVIGVNVLPNAGVGGPGPTTTPTPTTSAIPLPSGSLEPGTYHWPTDDPIVPVRFSFTVPSGWRNAGWGAIDKGGDGTLIVTPWTVRYTYRDPCRWMASVVDPGATVQGLVDALRQQIGHKATAAVPATIDGHEGQRIELDVNVTVDPQKCDGGEYRVWVAPGPGVTGTALQEPARYGLPTGFHSSLTILDVNGTRLIIEASYPAGTSAAVRAELQTIVDSIRFD